MKQRRHSQLLLGKIAVPDKKLKERPKQVKKKVSLYKAGNIAFTGITGVRLVWCVPHSAWSMLGMVWWTAWARDCSQSNIDAGSLFWGACDFFGGMVQAFMES